MQTSSIYVYDKRIREQISEIKSLIDQIRMHGDRDAYYAKISMITHRYNIVSVPFILGDRKSPDEYLALITSDGIHPQIIAIAAELKTILSTQSNEQDGGILSRVDAIMRGDSLLGEIDIAMMRAQQNERCARCGCIRVRRHTATTDDIICEGCGESVRKCIVADDEQYDCDPQRSSAVCAGANHLRHLKIWMDNLQAIEQYMISEDDITAIRASITSEFISSRDIRWSSMRYSDFARHVSLCRLTHLNSHIPKLMKLLGARAPPILNFNARQIIDRDFARIMEIHSRLITKTGNKPYYPFFIAKIVKRRFAGDAEVMRILDYITQQGRDTVTKNDKIYERICREAPAQYDLVYEPEIDA